MALPNLDYWRAFLRAAPFGDVVRAAARRLTHKPRLPDAATISDARAAAESLAAAPPLFPDERSVRALYRLLAPGAIADAHRRAGAILRNEIEIFGRPCALGTRIDWHRDPRGLPEPREPRASADGSLSPHGSRPSSASLYSATSHSPGRSLFGAGSDEARAEGYSAPSGESRFDSTRAVSELNVLAPGLDPRGPWELGRCAHLVELGAAAVLCPELLPAARARVFATITSFLDDNPIGRGIHWASPLEAAVRVVNWMTAVDLVGGLRGSALSGANFEARFARRFGAALVEHARFLERNPEDRGAVPGNHLLGGLVGLTAVALRLGGLTEAARWRDQGLARLRYETARQVANDGSDFEASTGYHRFVLELLLAVDRFAAAAGLDAGLDETLHRMFSFVAGYVGADGSEPGFGDGDDGRCMPLLPHQPRDHGYLLAVGAARFGDPTLKPVGARFSEEAAWLCGAAGYRRWRALPALQPPGSLSFIDGGVHVLRGDGVYAAMRCGGYGQHGVGGHAHNDQLAVVLSFDGAPLVIDSGTCCYTSDPIWRDRYRGTAAHSTVVVEAVEQSPLYDGRPFALPDAARSRLLDLDDTGHAARVVGEHHGYRRLPARVVHRRELLLDRERHAVLVTDTLLGHGAVTVEARFQLGDTTVRAACLAEQVLVRELAEPSTWGDALRADDALVLLVRGRPAALLAPLGATPSPTVDRGWWSRRYGERHDGSVLRFAARVTLPVVYSVAIFHLRHLGDTDASSRDARGRDA